VILADDELLAHLAGEATAGVVANFVATTCAAHLGYGAASGRRTLAAQLDRLVAAGAITWMRGRGCRPGTVVIRARDSRSNRAPRPARFTPESRGQQRAIPVAIARSEPPEPARDSARDSRSNRALEGGPSKEEILQVKGMHACMPVATSAAVLRSITVALPRPARERFLAEGAAGRRALGQEALEHLASGWGLDRLVAELVADDLAGAKRVTAVLLAQLRALPLAAPEPSSTPADGDGEAAASCRRTSWAAWARTLVDVEDLDDEQRVEALVLRGVDDAPGVLAEARAQLGLAVPA